MLLLKLPRNLAAHEPYPEREPGPVPGGLAAHEGPASRLVAYTADLVQRLQQLELTLTQPYN